DEYRRAARWRVTDPEKPVFLNTKSEELSYSSVYKSIKRAWKRSGNSSAEADVSTHWLRHTTAYSVLRSELGATWQDKLLILKGMLGHNSIKTTEIYCSIPVVVMHSINRPDGRPLYEEAAEIYRSTYLPPAQSCSPE
ncbi:MAG: site-specific integrase, partial [Acidobacteriota bacterium]|nr:site-specific integrase [Acidobacteriota bacterium]